MTLAQALQCEKRDVSNAGYLKELKRNGWVPGIVYGKGKESMPVMLSGSALEKIFQKHGYHGVFSLQIKGEKPALVLVRDYQKHPISGRLLHVDFLSVNADEKINNEVTLQFLGEEELIKQGHVLQMLARTVEVSCLPGDIPEAISVDISGLNVGDKISASDLTLPANVELVTEADFGLVTVSAPARADVEEDEENPEAKEATPAEGE